MHLKRNRVATVREARARARQEIGRDALVPSARPGAVRGVKGWLGAVEVELMAPDPAMSGSRPGSRLPDVLPTLGADDNEPMAAPTDPMVVRLCAARLHRRPAERIARSVPRSQRHLASPAMMTEALARHFCGVTAGDEASAPVELFVGPPNAGKTTTIAKIALEASQCA